MAIMTPAERRAALLEWFYADEERNGWGTAQVMQGATYWPVNGRIITRAWIYPPEYQTARHRAYRDLRALARDGHITRGQHGGKATWWYA